MYKCLWCLKVRYSSHISGIITFKNSRVSFCDYKPVMILVLQSGTKFAIKLCIKCRLKCFRFLKTETDVDVTFCFYVRFISYPRTETNMFPKSLDLRPLVQNQTVDENWGGMFEINVIIVNVL